MLLQSKAEKNPLVFLAREVKRQHSEGHQSTVFLTKVCPKQRGYHQSLPELEERKYPPPATLAILSHFRGKEKLGNSSEAHNQT